MHLPAIIKPPLWTAFRALSRLGLAVHGQNYRYVFILAHMRSGSTLLAHILANHPDFAGAGESHVSYQTPADLGKLVLKTCELLHNPFLRGPYFVDQINHDYVSDEVLRSDRLHRCLILIREPESTLKSTIKMLGCSEEAALDVYVKRLELLTHYGMLLKQRAFLVDYETLVSDAEATLAAITRFLQLSSPLRSSYETHRMTGRIVGYGDPSGNIKLGHVMRTPRHDDIALGSETLDAAAAAFAKSRNALQQLLAGTALGSTSRDQEQRDQRVAS